MVDEDDELEVEATAAVIVVNEPLIAELDAGTELDAAAPAGEELVDEAVVVGRFGELDMLDRLDRLDELNKPTVLEVAVVGLGTAELEDVLEPVDELGPVLEDTIEDMLDDWLETDELLAEEIDDAEELLDCDMSEEDKELEKTLLAEDDADEE